MKMKKSLDPTILQSKTSGVMCALIHDMQKEIKRLSLKNDRANENTKNILRNSASLLRIRLKEIARVENFKKNREFFSSGI